jgi:hypothetical protein
MTRASKEKNFSLNRTVARSDPNLTMDGAHEHRQGSRNEAQPQHGATRKKNSKVQITTRAGVACSRPRTCCANTSAIVLRGSEESVVTRASRPCWLRTSLRNRRISSAARNTHGRDGVTIEMRQRSYVSNSTAIATASPPPMQRESIPIRAFRCRIALSSVTSVRAPLAPMGCPSATAPPFTFSFS